ncbi:hypothetical protein D3C84_1061710 [compost metagenome]
MHGPVSDVVARCFARTIDRDLAGMIGTQTLLNRGVRTIGITHNNVEVRRDNIVDPLLHFLMQVANRDRSSNEYSCHGLFPGDRGCIDSVDLPIGA